MKQNKRNCTGTACRDCRHMENASKLGPAFDMCYEAPRKEDWVFNSWLGCEVALPRSAKYVNTGPGPCPHYEPTRWKRFKNWGRIR